MPTYTKRSTLPVTAQELFQWHQQPAAFERLVPPWQKVELVSKPAALTNGSELLFDLVLKIRFPRGILTNLYYG